MLLNVETHYMCLVRYIETHVMRLYKKYIKCCIPYKPYKLFNFTNFLTLQTLNYRFNLGSSASLNPSPTRLTAKIVSIMASEGNTASPQLEPAIIYL